MAKKIGFAALSKEERRKISVKAGKASAKARKISHGSADPRKLSKKGAAKKAKKKAK